jgi:Flp pilus assembly protein TadG
MSRSKLFETLRRGVCRLANSNDGLAAVEFAVIAPVFIIMYFGLVEYTLAQDARTKSTSVASTAADLIAQEREVCDPEMSDAFAALNAIMYPFPPNSMKIRITSVIPDGSNGFKVAWSDAQNMAPRNVDETVSIPTGLVSANGSVIMAEINYTYDSPYNYFFPSTMDLPDTFYFHPRKAQQIARTVMCNI